VGPDNGLLIPAAEALGGLKEAWLIDEDRLRSRAGLAGGTVSATFHGRDIFAPAAALLAASVPVADIARPYALHTLVRLEPAVVDITPAGIVAEVVEIDRFGNVGLAAHFDDWAFASTSVTVEVIGEDLPDWNAHVVQTFGQLGSGELGVYRDSWGHLALALNGASAAQLLSVDRGTMIRISPQGAE
jgi:S-adenosylmethionine hydrolase